MTALFNLKNSSKNLPLFNSSNVGGAKRNIQDKSVTKLQQERDREEATVSVDQARRGASGSAVTSVSHMGQEADTATSSIMHPGRTKDPYSGEDEVDEVRDRLRYAHIRSLIKQRQAEEREAQERNQPSIYDIGTKTGGGFRQTGRTGIRRRWAKLRRSAPATYKNLSAKDIEYYQSVVSPHAKAVKRGTGFGRKVRKKMKVKIEQDRRKGIINWDDAKDMKKMVDNLPH